MWGGGHPPSPPGLSANDISYTEPSQKIFEETSLQLWNIQFVTASLSVGVQSRCSRCYLYKVLAPTDIQTPPQSILSMES